MKKILIAAAIVCAAVVSQAASTSWKFTSAAMKDASLTTAYAGVVQIWASGGDLDEATMIGSGTAKSGTLSNYSFSTTELTAGQTYDIYYVLTDTQSGVDYTLTSTSKSSLAAETGATTVNWGNQGTYTSTASNWVAAPEPTSGLLLLLGMAGLALKRKRA